MECPGLLCLECADTAIAHSCAPAAGPFRVKGFGFRVKDEREGERDGGLHKGIMPMTENRKEKKWRRYRAVHKD